jgi:hypothetical protein
LDACIKNTERSKTNDIILQLKLLEKKEQAKLQISRKREIIKIRARIREIENERTYKKSVKPKVTSLKR